jgi:acetylornithine/N-succinyldiaminopimelate aminotransferase
VVRSLKSLSKFMITSQLLDTANESLLFTAHRPQLVMERGEGMYLWDTEGRKYLDFIGGWAVTSLGHSPRVIQAALNAQAALLVNASPSFFNTPMIEFAALLTDISCFDKVFFASSGAEANEGAIKLARKYGAKNLGGAYEIITMTSGFHGRTITTMAATGKAEWRSLFAPLTTGFHHVPMNDIEACKLAMNRNTCAVMLELIQGEGGVHAVEHAYIHELRSLCEERGILLIIDEIQTGIGRTGKMFAYEHYGIQADIMTLGKGIGGGFPLSAMLTTDKLNIFDAGDQGGTYSAQPLSMAVGLAVVREIMDRKLPLNAQNQGDYLRDRLHERSERYQLSNIRGKGLLLAFELPKPIGQHLVSQCRDKGLLINSPHPNTIRLMPPLIVTRADIDVMLGILCSVLDDMKV